MAAMRKLPVVSILYQSAYHNARATYSSHPFARSEQAGHSPQP